MAWMTTNNVDRLCINWEGQILEVNTWARRNFSFANLELVTFVKPYPRILKGVSFSQKSYCESFDVTNNLLMSATSVENLLKTDS
jgi:hypothetical protein